MIGVLEEEGRVFLTSTETIFIPKDEVQVARRKLNLYVNLNFVPTEDYYVRVDGTNNLISKGVFVHSELIPVNSKEVDLVLAIHNAGSTENWAQNKRGILVERGKKLASLTLIKKEKAQLTLV
ncbi:hypothetical protein EBZ38_07535 [bacterium]|nr:hypothetical protein [bacterium]